MEYELDFGKLKKMSNCKEKAIGYAINGLFIDGGDHKQWILEKILKALNVDLDKVREDGDWDNGIAP